MQPMNTIAVQSLGSGKRLSALLVVILHALLLALLIQGLAPHPLPRIEPKTLVVNLLQPLQPAPPPPPPVVMKLRPATPPPRPLPPPPQPAPAPAPAPSAPPVASTSPATSPPAATAEPERNLPAQNLPKGKPLRHGISPIYMPPLEELQRRYPRAARREGLSGKVLIRLSVAPDGHVTDATVRQATPPGLFDELALDYVKRFRFATNPEPFLVDQALVFTLDQ